MSARKRALPAARPGYGLPPWWPDVTWLDIIVGAVLICAMAFVVKVVNEIRWRVEAKESMRAQTIELMAIADILRGYSIDLDEAPPGACLRASRIGGKPFWGQCEDAR